MAHKHGVCRGTEEKWKIPLLDIVGIQPKCFGKRSQSHREERHGVNEANVPTLVGELQQFATRTHGLKLLFALNQRFHNKVRVIGLGILRKSCDVQCVLPAIALLCYYSSLDKNGGICQLKLCLLKSSHEPSLHITLRSAAFRAITNGGTSGSSIPPVTR